MIASLKSWKCKALHWRRAVFWQFEDVNICAVPFALGDIGSGIGSISTAVLLGMTVSFNAIFIRRWEQNRLQRRLITKTYCQRFERYFTQQKKTKTLFYIQWYLSVIQWFDHLFNQLTVMNSLKEINSGYEWSMSYRYLLSYMNWKQEQVEQKDGNTRSFQWKCVKCVSFI